MSPLKLSLKVDFGYCVFSSKNTTRKYHYYTLQVFPFQKFSSFKYVYKFKIINVNARQNKCLILVSVLVNY